MKEITPKNLNNSITHSTSSQQLDNKTSPSKQPPLLPSQVSSKLDENIISSIQHQILNNGSISEELQKGFNKLSIEYQQQLLRKVIDNPTLDNIRTKLINFFQQINVETDDQLHELKLFALVKLKLKEIEEYMKQPQGSSCDKAHPLHNVIDFNIERKCPTMIFSNEFNTGIFKVINIEEFGFHPTTRANFNFKDCILLTGIDGFLEQPNESEALNPIEPNSAEPLEHNKSPDGVRHFMEFLTKDDWDKLLKHEDVIICGFDHALRNQNVALLELILKKSSSELRKKLMFGELEDVDKNSSPNLDKTVTVFNHQIREKNLENVAVMLRYFTEDDWTSKNLENGIIKAFDDALRTQNVALLELILKKSSPELRKALMFGELKDVDKNSSPNLDKTFSVFDHQIQEKNLENVAVMLRYFTDEDIKTRISFLDGSNKIKWFKFAVSNGAACVVRFFLQNYDYVNLNLVDEDGNKTSPLMAAVECGNVEMVTLLLDYNADVNLVDENGNNKTSPLMAAVECGNVDMVTLLLDKGAHVNLVDEDGNNKTSPLMAVVKLGNVDMVTLLLGCNADVNLGWVGSNGTRRPPLMAAVESGNDSYKLPH